MVITFQLLAQTVIAALLITVAVICWMYGDEDIKTKEEEEEEEEEARLVGDQQRKWVVLILNPYQLVDFLSVYTSSLSLNIKLTTKFVICRKLFWRRRGRRGRPLVLVMPILVQIQG